MRKLTENEWRAREVNKIIQKIRNFEKIHTQDLIKSACNKYNIAIQDKKRAEQDIRDAEERLFDAKKRLKK